MKLLKRFLLVIGILIAAFLIVALFIKKDYAVVREISINKPKAEVFAYLKSLKNQENWSTWTQADPEMKMIYRGTDGQVGSIAVWESKMMGDGEQEVLKIAEGKRIDAELRFKGMMASTSPAYLETLAINDSTTQVKWAMSGKMTYPMNFMQVFMSMDDMIGTEYEKSLAQLKEVLEK
jgi:hypothetical protein